MKKCCCINQFQYITKTIQSLSMRQIYAEIFFETIKINNAQNKITKNGTSFAEMVWGLEMDITEKKIDSLSGNQISAKLFLGKTLGNNFWGKTLETKNSAKKLKFEHIEHTVSVS